VVHSNDFIHSLCYPFSLSGAQGDQSVSEPIDQMAYSSPLKQSSFGLSHDIDDLNNSTPYLFKSMKLTPNASRK
jgi:hypothetical protein